MKNTSNPTVSCVKALNAYLSVFSTSCLAANYIALSSRREVNETNKNTYYLKGYCTGHSHKWNNYRARKPAFVFLLNPTQQAWHISEITVFLSHSLFLSIWFFYVMLILPLPSLKENINSWKKLWHTTCI